MAEEKDEYKKLIGKVGGHKSFLTRLADGVDAVVTAEALDGPELLAAEEKESNIRSRLDNIQEIFDGLLGNPHTTAEDMNTFGTYVEGIQGKLAKLRFRIAQAKAVVAPSPTSTNPSVPSSPILSSPESIVDNIRFPEMKLPSFSGGVNGTRDFRPFSQIFQAMVESKTSIPPIYKVQYLRGCLPEGSEARQLISHIPPVGENYDLIKTTLVSRYGNDTGEAYRLRRKLRDIGSWSVCNTVESQRKLVDHVRQNLALLEQVDSVQTEEMKSLALDLAGVIPERLRYKLVKKEKEERTVSTILDMLDDNIRSKLEVQSLADPAKTQAPKSQAPKPPARQHYSQAHYYHTAEQGGSRSPEFNSYQTAIEQVPSGNRGAVNQVHHSQAQGKGVGKSKAQSHQLASQSAWPCLYCGDKRHTPHTCVKMPIEDRAALVSKSNRCWNCLSDEHQVRSCGVASRCQCGQHGKHSQSLCGFKPPWRSKGKGSTYVASLVTTQGLMD